MTLTEGERLKGLKPRAVVCGLQFKLERIQIQQQTISAETLAFLDVLPTHEGWYGTTNIFISPFAHAPLIQSEHSHAWSALIGDSLNWTMDLQKVGCKCLRLGRCKYVCARNWRPAESGWDDN